MTSTPSEPRTLLTIQQVAQLLHVSDDTVRRQIREGDLPAVRLGTTPTGRPRYRIAEEVISRLLTTQPIKGPAADEQLQAIFAHLSDEQRGELITQALAWARAQQPQPSTADLPPEPSREEVQRRQAHSRLR